jgi:hypothetical protein
MMSGGELIIRPTAMRLSISKFCYKFLGSCSGVVEFFILHCLFFSFRNYLWSTDIPLSFSTNGCIEVVSGIVM